MIIRLCCKSEIECLSLPGFDKAVKAACCEDGIIVVCESGRVFECRLLAGKKSFSEVVELSGIKINEISCTYDHFFALSEDGRVFGCVNNRDNRLGMPSDIKQLNEFKVIESKNKYHVVEAFAGHSDSRLDPNSLLSFSSCHHSVWIIQIGEAVAVGDNGSGQIMSTMPKTTFQKDTKIEFRNKSGKPCKFISAVCGFNCTFYKVSGETNSDPSQLVYACWIKKRNHFS